MLLRFSSILFLVLSLGACSSLEFPWVYRISVQQGNIIDQEEIDQLEIGMTKRQVQFVLGSPILIDTFNPDRWDYIYTRRSGKGEVTDKRFSVFFENDRYVRHEGNVMPTEKKDPAQDQSSDEAKPDQNSLN